MKRREFIALLGGAATVPLLSTTVPAQPKAIRRVGFLGGLNVIAPQSESYRAFLSQLDELGFRAGRNVIVEYAPLSDPRGPGGVMSDLLRSKPEVVVITGPEIGLRALEAQSKTTAGVFLAIDYDPVAQKHVASLDKPGGNFTGVFARLSDLATRQIELFKDTLPGRKRLAVAWDAPTADHFAAVEAAGKAAGLDIIPIRHERPPYSIELMFRNFKVRKAQAAMILPSPHFGGRRSKIAELATRAKLPILTGSRAYVESGALMSLGLDYPSAMKKLGEYTARILRGDKPADLPVDTSPRLDLAVNIKTAKAIGVQLPDTVLLQASLRVDQ
jgi:putative tryptophan/tyrosine transport system substrate-binding protein